MVITKTDRPADKDLLGIEKYVNGLARFIEKCDTPLTIAVQGDWGSGKTSIMKQVNSALGKDIKTIFFNTWQYSQFNMSEELGLSFIIEFIEKLEQRGNSANRKKRWNFLSWDLLSKGIKYIDLPVINGEKISEDISSYFEYLSNRNKTIKEFKKEFNDIINNTRGKHDRIVIFIDDLDRLVPERAIELLEILKLFFDCERCVFVLAIDYDVVVRGVKSKYGEDFDRDKGRAFFDKIIQVPFTVPTASYNINSYIKDSLKELGFDGTGSEADSASIEVNLIKSSIGTNPRSINRLINSTSLLFEVDGMDSKDNREKQLILAIVCWQLEFEQIYNRFLSAYEVGSEAGEYEPTFDKLINLLENNFKMEKDEDNSLLSNDLMRFKRFYQYLKEVLNIEKNNKMTEEELGDLIRSIKLSNIVSTGNADISESCPNLDMQYVIRKLYNSLRGEDIISLDNPESFGKEPLDIRKGSLGKDILNKSAFRSVRLTRGSGYSLVFSNDASDEDRLEGYLAGTSGGKIVKEFTSSQGINEKISAKKSFSSDICLDAQKLRDDEGIYRAFEEEVIRIILDYRYQLFETTR
ncbi:NTPase protein [Streptococcus varani]|uniref:NTPase protein n=1 Tax=Streptococcus varani TaxID=1608583 RepID=A0A0E3WFR9_9STRE|nr:P-loop NTPase fold protein [Streptococcus varani]CQR26010.1 NTPase protein [Streptococcus varani]